jgi:hypothetical protein
VRVRRASLVVAAAVVAAGWAVTAQGRPDQAALPGIPKYAQGFQSWTRVNAKPIAPRSADPHYGVKNVYVNRTKARLAPTGKQRFPYPNGSIVVKAAKKPGERFVSLVAVMRKIKGRDPAHGDWVYVEWTRDRANERFRLQARDAVCWGCHAGAQKTDWVFTTLGR